MLTPSAHTVRTWYRVHKWTSLICTLFLFVTACTGLPLIFHDELDALLNAEVKPQDLPDSTPLASMDRMIRQAQGRYPKLVTYAAGFDEDSPRSFVTMSTSLNPQTARFKLVWFDEHTGRLLEAKEPGKDVMSLVLKLHSELFLSLPGQLLLAVVALLFVVSLLSGALVYGPFMRKLNFGTYRSQAPTATRWLDLHNLLGIVTLAWALVVGATGVMNALSVPLFGLWRMQVLPQLLAPYHGQPLPSSYTSVDHALAQAAATLPEMKVSSVLFPNAIVSSPRHYLVWTRGKTAVTSRLFTPALIDAGSGRVTLAKGLPWYLRALEVSRPLHFGDYGGLPLKVLWALFDVVTLVVLGSGLVLWLGKRKSRLDTDLDVLVKAELSGKAQ